MATTPTLDAEQARSSLTRPHGLSVRLRRMRVGTKLLLLAILPVCCVFALVVISAVSDFRAADRLSTYRAQTRLSSVLENLSVDLEHERRAAALVRIDPGAASQTLLAGYERATTRAFAQARARARQVPASVDIVGGLEAAQRQRQALVLQLNAGSLAPAQSISGYSVIAQNVLGFVAVLDGGAPSLASARAAAALTALAQAIESASRERVYVATLLAPRGQAPRTAESWDALEAAQLTVFRHSAAGPLVSDLEGVLFSPAGVAVQQFRGKLAANPAAAVRDMSLHGWLSLAGARIDALRGVAAATGAGLDHVVSSEIGGAQARALRDLAISLAFLAIVTVLALTLRRSIGGPLREVSGAARGLARGDMSTRVEYSSDDEIGDVAAAFHEVYATTERLVREIHAENRAVSENRLEHRADASGLDGIWSQLLEGMNETMASFTALQHRREHAERETARIFEMSLDSLCVIGFDGYFKRVNPAFERTLGYPREVLMSRPGFDFAHPDDLERSTEIFTALKRGEAVPQFENRNVCADGTVRWLQWSARAVPEEGLVYAVARDVTEARRASEEQAALRRVATLVAAGGAPEVVFATVAEELARRQDADLVVLLRYEQDGIATVVGGWGVADIEIPLGKRLQVAGIGVAVTVLQTRRPAYVGRLEGPPGSVASWLVELGIQAGIGNPIVVEDELWGVAVAASREPGALPPGSEARAAEFTELVATAIANAEARTALAHVANEQAALRRVATLVAKAAPSEEVFAAVAEEVGRLVPASDVAVVARYEPEDTLEFLGGWSADGDVTFVGDHVPLAATSVARLVRESGGPARVDHLHDTQPPGDGRSRPRCAAGAPITVGGGLWGAIVVGSTGSAALPAGVEHELADFTELVATAIANADAQAELTASRARIVASADEARRRIVRDLHDAAQQRLVHTIVTLKLAKRAREANDDQTVGELVEEALGHAEGANTELRELVYGILPGILNRGGLAPSVAELARRLRIPVDVEVSSDRFPTPIEATAYFVIAEALTNVAKHSGAQSAQVRAEVVDHTLKLDVHDDGIGGARREGSGLGGLTDRVVALGGELEVDSPEGGGTRVTATLPLPG